MPTRFGREPPAFGPAQRWAAQRTFHHGQLPPERVAAERESTISVCLPARDEATTIGPILDCLMPLIDQGVVDQVVVVADGSDGTHDIAAGRGAEVHDQSALCSNLGPVQGKGDAMWRALTVLTGEVVCFLDADSEHFGCHFAAALAGAVAIPGPTAFAKAFYRRPFRIDEGTKLPTGGGRVTELTARPLLRAFYPELAEIRQPLAGEIAARRDLLEQIPFGLGYAVDIGLLIDAWRHVGLEGIAQVDLDVRQNRHQSLEELGPMAQAVLAGVIERLHRDGCLEAGEDRLPWPERPPIASLYESRELWSASRRTPAMPNHSTKTEAPVATTTT
ncbi:MAG: Glucosyl-3-phosphoglycerate synthase [uncultured Solirubrobacteraceae bacterium]|uniref:Glucosyl-3-phosphoglycerate synthase n=1 Tax=uncultured Solirubrobacteraceae bacterium TaxID=1162706 RepID=A0A6J4S7U7_9ACTN|nr:MAG: Glucosyl-3-phosphoglycerate synthase [uncultured Solirubrobacteraceae bacterium]